MSLIDDALKQAQATHPKDEERSEGKLPWTPPPLPDRSRLIRARIGRILGFSLLTVLAAGVALVIALRSRRPAPARSPASDAVQASSAAAGLPPITSEVTVAPPQRAMASGPPASAGARQAGVPPQSAQGGAPGPSARENDRPVTAPQVEPARIATPSAERPLDRRGRAPAGPAVFAGEMPLAEGGKITLDGIVYSETNPVAVLNGKILPPGAEVDGYTITRIYPDKIELEREGKSVSLTLR